MPMDLSKLSDGDLDALSKGAIEHVSDEGLKYLAGTGVPHPENSNPHAVANNIEAEDNSASGMLKKAIGFGASHMAGVVKAGTLGNLDLTQQKAFQNPVANKTGQLEGAIGTGALVGSAMPVAGNALTRILLGTGQGAATGALSKPEGDETRLGNAAKGAAVGGIASAGLEAVRGLGNGVKAIYKSYSPGSAIDNKAALDEVLGDKSVKFAGSPMPAQEVDTLRRGSEAGSDTYRAAAAALHQDPAISAELRNQSAAFTGNKDLRDIGADIRRGNLLKILQIPGASAMQGAMGAGRSTLQPSPSHAASLQSLLNLLDTPKEGR